MIQQQPNKPPKNLSLQPYEKLNSDHTQDDLQNPNPTLDNQSTSHTLDSNTILVPVRFVTEQDP